MKEKSEIKKYLIMLLFILIFICISIPVSANGAEAMEHSKSTETVENESETDSEKQFKDSEVIEDSKVHEAETDKNTLTEEKQTEEPAVISTELIPEEKNPESETDNKNTALEDSESELPEDSSQTVTEDEAQEDSRKETEIKENNTDTEETEKTESSSDIDSETSTDSKETEKSEDNSSETEAAEPAEKESEIEVTEPAEESNMAMTLKRGEEKKTEPDAIYLDGIKGKDGNDGKIKETAVKSFEKAKKIATENKNIKTIYIIGTVSVSENINLEGTNAVIMRDSEYGGSLFNIKEEATFTNITVDGNRDNVSASVKSVESMIEVNGKLIIGEGAVLQNNKAYKASGKLTGGAVKITNGTVEMSGGIIQNNEANDGGGVYVDSSTFNMSGGIIQNNRAYGKNKVEYGSGGGICAYNNVDNGPESFISISGNALVKNNAADERGGGIALGTRFASGSKITLKMYGGTITGNSSGAGAGGLFIQAGIRDKQSIAYIYGGEISNNVMTGKGLENHAFGGGGIYVNGYPEKNNSNLVNGELYLYNAVITDNTAVMEGGGFAACPVTRSKVYLKNGVAIYGNNGSGAKDVYVLASNDYDIHSGNPKYEISPVMLGGVPYIWKYDDGTEVPLDKLHGVLYADKNEELRLHTDSMGSPLTQKLAKVFIFGNWSATRGAGVGSNGTVIFGEEDLTEVPVTKEWEFISKDKEKYPESVMIKLYAKTKENPEEIYIGYQLIQPDKDGNWKIKFENLPKTDNNGNEYIYTIKEKDLDGFEYTVTGDQTGYIITNKETPPDNPPDKKEPPDKPTPPDNPPEEPTVPEVPEEPIIPEKPEEPVIPEVPVVPETPQVPKKNLPKTGEGLNPEETAMLLAAAGMVLISYGVYRKKKTA